MADRRASAESGLMKPLRHRSGPALLERAAGRLEERGTHSFDLWPQYFG